MNDWVKIRQNILDAFVDVPRPDFRSIPILGCCEKHESDFDWYRHHTWQEFENAQETRGFDSADFVAIHPLAFHYCTPGVTRTAIKRLATDYETCMQDESWLGHYVISPDRMGSFKSKYLPYFDSAQRQAIAGMLAWYKEWYLLCNGFDYDESDENDEDFGKITDSINLVWEPEI